MYIVKINFILKKEWQDIYELFILKLKYKEKEIKCENENI